TLTCWSRREIMTLLQAFERAWTRRNWKPPSRACHCKCLNRLHPLNISLLSLYENFSAAHVSCGQPFIFSPADDRRSAYLQNSMLFCEVQQPRCVLHFEFPQDVLAVGVHGELADRQLMADLFACQLTAHHPDDLHFTAR